jgi:DNA-binding SARP family transcriptional activator
MPTLLIRLLGSPKIEIDGVPIALDRNKAIALLVYLAVTGRSHQRDTLATLLWPESDHSHARASLRRDLSVLNKALGGFALEIARDTVRLDRGKLWLDVAQFNSLVEQGRSFSKGDKETICTICLEHFAEAVQLYTEDFLSGFTLPDCPEFDEWQFFQVESLRQTYLGTLERLVNGYTQLRTPDQALAYARRWVGKDPTHEPAHMALIRIYADMGQQAAALRQYQVCVDTLHDELGLKPSSELTALYKQIRTSRQATPVAEKLIPELHPLHMHNIPVHPTPFLGRDRERAEINQRLNDPNCHLLTLIGPGGIGKTRLAIRAAQDVAAQPDSTSKYSDGIYFVSLASTQTAYQLVTSIAAAVDFSFYAEVDPQNQLLGYLSQRKMLLVLDNFEQLLVLVDHTN